MGDRSAFAAMLLADGRLPAGSHVHSAGIESAVADERVRDMETLRDFTAARLRTVGLTDAALAAATTIRLLESSSSADARGWLRTIDDEADARLAAPTLRQASRRQGRQLARVAARCWSDPVLALIVDLRPDDGVHLSVTTGAVGVAASLPAESVVDLVLHHAIATPTQAAVRLLGLDPFAVAALCAELAAVASDVATAALAAGRGPLDDLPAVTGPVVDIAAADHGGWDLRLFAT